MVNFLKKYWILIAVSLLGVVCAFVLSRTGRISIEVSTDQNVDPYTYQILNQSGAQPEEFVQTSNTLSKTLPRGNYQVLVLGGGQSYFGVVEVGGFLKQTKVVAQLKDQVGREFVGDNPDPCMYYQDGTLYSFICKDPSRNLKQHVPATADRATYTNTISNSPKTTQIGFSQNDYVKYGGGFISYDQSTNQILYYPTPQADTSQPLGISIPRDQPYSLTNLDSQDGLVIAAFINTNSEDINQDDPDHSNVTTQLLIYDGTNTKQFTFEDQLATTVICGENLVCALVDRQMQVFDVSGSKQKLLYKVVSVDSIAKSESKLVLGTNNSLIDFDASTRSGYRLYEYGEYRSCGAQTYNNELLFCLINPENRKTALRLLPDAPPSDIDKQIIVIESIPEVKAVSINHNHIFIVPDFGPLVYDSSSQQFTYSPVAKKKAIDAINTAIGKSGIDRSLYTINITGE